MTTFKKGDKVVFDNGNTKHYILIRKFIKVKNIKLINGKFIYKDYIRRPTTIEKLTKNFI